MARQSVLNETQNKFLELLFERRQVSACEACEALGLKHNVNDDEINGGAYTALNDAIGYMVGDEESFIGTLFTIERSFDDIPNHDTYRLTPDGEQFVERTRSKRNSVRREYIAILVAIVGAVAAIIALYK